MAKELRSNADYIKEVERANGLAVVEFSASWCRPCKKIARVVSDWAKDEFRDVAFSWVDVDKVDGIAEAFKVSKLPTFLLYMDGREVGMMSGADARELRELILANLG